MDISYRKQRFALALLATLALSTPGVVDAAELYKVVDEDGNVTFSQFPPSEPQGEVENVKLEGVSDAMTALTQAGNLEYCGEIELPSADYYQAYERSTDRFLRQVGNRKKSWQRQLEGLEKQINNSTRNQYSRNTSAYYRNSSYQSQQDLANFERKEAQLKNIRDLRCAVHWADQRDSEMNQFREQNHTELKRLEGVQQNLLGQLRRNCGAEPALDPSDKGAKLRRQQWLDCSKDYQRDLRDVSRQLQTVSQKISATLP